MDQIIYGLDKVLSWSGWDGIAGIIALVTLVLGMLSVAGVSRSATAATKTDNLEKFTDALNKGFWNTLTFLLLRIKAFLNSIYVPRYLRWVLTLIIPFVFGLALVARADTDILSKAFSGLFLALLWCHYIAIWIVLRLPVPRLLQLRRLTAFLLVSFAPPLVAHFLFVYKVLPSETDYLGFMAALICAGPMLSICSIAIDAALTWILRLRTIPSAGTKLDNGSTKV